MKRCSITTNNNLYVYDFCGMKFEVCVSSFDTAHIGTMRMIKPVVWFKPIN